MGVVLTEPITSKDIEEQDNNKEYIDLMEAGWYDVEIISSDQQTSAGGFNYLSVVFRILFPEKHENKLKYWAFFIYDGSEKGIAFNRALLGRIARACGVDFLETTDQIEGKRFSMKVSVDKYNGEDKNNIKDVSPSTFKPKPDVGFAKVKKVQPAQVSDDDEIPF